MAKAKSTPPHAAETSARARQSAKPRVAKASAKPALEAKTRRPTKGDLLITLLQRPDGVTAAQMAEATGWQLHSVRGFIAGAVKRKLGHTVTTEKLEGQTVYRIAGGSASPTTADAGKATA
jgi:hypothetical protein